MIGWDLAGFVRDSASDMLSASSSGSHPIPQLGPYLVEGEIAKGAQGAVYLARHTLLGTAAALKVIHQRDPVALERFRRETSALANLHHPGLPRVIDVGEQGGLVFAAFELVEGPTLKELVRTRGVQPLEWTLDLVARLAEAVDYCHQRGVLHRDLKPENVLIEEGSGRPVLVDFGLVKLSGASAADIGTQQRLSLTGEVRGTPNYMAPEQIEDSKRAGPLADVYGLGGLLYTVICRQPPYTGKSVGTVLRKVQQGALDLPRDLVPDLEPELEAICLKALARDPAERYESADAFSRALDEWVKGRLGKSGPVRLKGPGEQ